jgi:predicted type IV restriction endonuclease
MSVPGQVVGLVERFEADRKTYRSTAYKEQWVRQDFIDPLFEALGWDVVNKSGVPVGPHRGVIPEDAIRVRGATKAPDYGFYIGGTRKFYVEAKIAGERPVVQHQIVDATDRQIDRLVYDLYGLTDEEVEIVEQETR